MLHNWHIHKRFFEDQAYVICRATDHKDQTFILKVSKNAPHSEIHKQLTFFKQHPSLVGVAYPLETFETDESLVLKFNNMTTLNTWLSHRNTLNEGEVHSFAIKLLDILISLHEQKLSHRPLMIHDFFITLDYQSPLLFEIKNTDLQQKDTQYSQQQHLSAIGKILLNICCYQQQHYIENTLSLEATTQILSLRKPVQSIILSFLDTDDSFSGLKQKLKNNAHKSLHPQDEDIITLRSHDSSIRVAAIAHEFNTPLGICTSALSHLENAVNTLQLQTKKGLKKSDLESFLNNTAKPIKMIKNNIHKSSKFAEKFRHLQSTDYKKENIRIREFIDEMFEEIALQFPKEQHISLKSEIIGVQEIISYPLEITQILTNLIMNSVYHGFKDRENGNIQVRITITSKMLHMNYIDNGNGIPAENIDKIFKTTFTTGSKRGRTGLGLSLIKDIIEEGFKGEISCSSELSKQTQFIIKLPHPV
ncbi:MAG: ATP-binding protein [Oligoflexales bacterium]